MRRVHLSFIQIIYLIGIKCRGSTQQMSPPPVRQQPSNSCEWINVSLKSRVHKWALQMIIPNKSCTIQALNLPAERNIAHTIALQSDICPKTDEVKIFLAKLFIRKRCYVTLSQDITQGNTCDIARSKVCNII